MYTHERFNNHDHRQSRAKCVHNNKLCTQINYQFCFVFKYTNITKSNIFLNAKKNIIKQLINHEFMVST